MSDISERETADQAEPSIAEKPDEVEAEEGGLIQIRVIVNGQPEPIVTWKRGNVELVSGQKYQASQSLVDIHQSKFKD